MKLVISFSYSILLNCKIKKQRSLFVGELYCGREIEIRVYPFNFENAHKDFFKGIKRSRSCKNPNIHNKSTCPILELNFLRILSRKRQSCRNLADPRTRDSSRLYICIEKTRKKRRKEKKVREEQNVSSRRELPTIRFLSRLFFVCHASLFSLGGWILLIVTGESWVKIVRGGWKKKKEGKTMVVKRSVVISETLDFTRGGERIAFSSTINKRRLESIVGYFSTTKETAISMRQTRRN